MENVFEGQDSFRGADPPHLALAAGGVDLAGKRVGVVGIGATGIQVIQTIADEVEHLTVFARTPQYVLPMKSPHYGAGGAGRVQGALRRAEGDDPAHVHRLRVRLRARLGRLHARAAPGGPRGDLRGRLAEVVARQLRGDVLLPGRQRGGLRVRPGEDARPPEGPAPDRRPGPHRLRLRHPPRAAGAQLPGGLPPRQRRPGRRARQPDRPDRPRGHRARRRHRPRARRDRAWPPASTPAPARSPASTSAAARVAASPTTGAATSAR